ncbi:hypothetical protein EZV61_04510 [Corallincola luteus]|uniref:Lipoprotein n=1 Tax=Corallincola luteus TaxID=1775177 RepID=A0ABY2ASX1_9GAMM|nr:YajG family lipoprotein [Corallincola luteus]TCI05227.1 hypothetical protein EZV61_04510 [Corallincola luteus]
MLKTLSLKALLFAFCGVFIAGCSSQYSPIIISPPVIFADDVWPDAQPIALKVEDMRPAQYLAKIQGSGEKVTLVPGNNSLSEVVNVRVAAAFNEHGIDVNPLSPIEFNIELHSALVDVTKPGHFDYDIDTHIKIEVNIKKSTGQFTKLFRGKRQTIIAIKPDTAKLEEELNALLGKVLNELVNDGEIHQFIARQPTDIVH